MKKYGIVCRQQRQKSDETFWSHEDESRRERMDEQALTGLRPTSDSSAQRRAMAYFEQMKQMEDGWQICGSALTQGLYEDDHVKFFCFQILEHFIKTRYRTVPSAQQTQLREMLLRWLQVQSMSGKSEKTFIRNKAAQLFSLVFVIDYPHNWLSFFSDLHQLLNYGSKAVDIYLRILMAIDTEVVDREILHTAEESQRNTMIKDAMRDHSVRELVDTWYQILTTYENTCPEVTCLCLDVVGAYVSWIDITLIANDKFMALLLQHLGVDVLQESACDCLLEIISKGMNPVDKTELVESLIKVLETAGVLPPKEDEDIDFLAKLAKLINGVGTNLLASWTKLVKSGDQENTQKTFQAANNKVPLMLRFLGDEDDDISAAVIEFTHDYVTSLKQIPNGSQIYKSQLQSIMYTIIKKFEYDESYNFEREGEDEVMFMEYRKQLKVVFDNIAQLDNQLVLATVHQVVMATLRQWESVKFTEVELAVRFLYNIGEAIPANQSNHFMGDSPKVTAMKEMMSMLVTSRVVGHSHFAVGLQVFETICRYDKFFNLEPQHIPEVIAAFLDERGLRNRHVNVRSRTSYLFCRFVKAVRSHLHLFVEEILKRLQEVMVITPPDNGHPALLSSDDKLFIFEAAGVLVVASQYPPEKKLILMKSLLAPVIAKFNTVLSKLCKEQDEEQQLVYAELVSQCISCASRTSKAFHTNQTMKQCGCEQCYLEALQVFLHALDTPYQRQIVHSAVRQYLHRMIVCLENTVLPYIPIAVEHLLKGCSAKDIQEFIPLINQIISKFKKLIVPFVQEVFMPVVTTIFTVLMQPVDSNDTQAAKEKQTLQRSYFQFLQALVINDVVEVISNQSPQDSHQVLMTVIEGAVNFPDPVSQKTCFAILRKLVEVWGGEDGPQGFREFIYKNIIPACFHAPLKSTFDLNDGQTFLALQEDSALLKTILAKQGAKAHSFLQHEYLPSLQILPELAQEFCQLLEQTEIKVFRNYFKAFLQRLKT
ncbi:exportin-T-like isoform X2 [Ptychodera flava]|uniref:exportin-T-like isoform X2 n=1 Tax=Ptychodera flava TaxID=63121 RepID=UPI00396A2F19